MSRREKVEEFFRDAEVLEKKYDWLKAIDLYKQALGAVGKRDFLWMGEIQERIGFCFRRAAFQAETREDFKSRIGSAVRAYEKAAELFDNVEGLDKLAKTSHCKAMGVYANLLLAADLSMKRKQLDECWRLEKEALRVYEKAADHMNVGKTCNNLMVILTGRLNIEWDAESREKIVKEALEYGEKAIEIFSQAEDRHQLAETYTKTAFFHRNGAFARGFKTERREECRQKALSYPQKAIEISDELGDSYLIGASNICVADTRLDILGTFGLEERLHYKKALKCAILTKDNLLIASALWGLEFATAFSATTQEDPDKAREEYRKLDKYWEDAIRHYGLICNDLGIALAYFLKVFPVEERSGLETNLEDKRLLIEKSIELGYRGLDHSRFSGSIGATFHITRDLGKAISCLARIETDASRKRSLLNESAKLIEQSIDILKQASAVSLVEPREENLMAILWVLATYQVELANTEENVDAKIKTLENAITSMQSARESFLKWIKTPWARVEKPLWFLIGENEMKTGKTLNQLYALTSNRIFLGDGVEAFERSVDAYDKADAPSRVAEAYWQIAKTYNQLADYFESAKNFESASKNYRLAAEKMPQLKGFYMGYSSYMQAWGEIEKARECHTKEEYSRAKEYYENAASLHKSTERWNYLSPNYSAWARLEEAEDLSRREQTQEAKDLFQQAIKMFIEASKSTEARLERIEVGDEKQMAVELIKASDLRKEYCLARISIEEAKILDRQGDHTASSKKYESAAEILQKIAKAEPEQTRKELEPIIYLCQAWRKMMMAEAKASSTMYGEAAELFKQAKEHTLDQPTSLLCLANSSFCMALEAGTEFEITRDMTMYSTAKRHMEAAANYYLKAGFKEISEYARATHRLFDAYMYMSLAETEADPAKKTKYYQMAEKLLQISVGSYLKAKHPEKSEEVRRLLKSVKEEQQLAMSLTEVLHAPTITSATTSFSTPTPTHEKAVGLERFEHADVQANLILREKEVRVGEDIDLEIELVNAGKAPALLIKVEEIIPEDFEIKQVPEIYRVEDRYLNMKGKRLDPLKTEEVKVVVKPLSKGMFVMKPRILYLDETGKYKSHEPEPVPITVKELGIKGWIKGEK